jgi:predicted kinase
MIHLICGHTGAGKSTYTRKLAEQRGAIYFSLDDWMKTLYFPDQEDEIELQWMLQRIERCEQLMWPLCQQIIQHGKEVIFDVGLSKYSHRQKFRDLANLHDMDCQLHYLSADKQTRLQRVISRNQLQTETYSFEVTTEMFEFMESWVEEPSEEELLGAITVET